MMYLYTPEQHAQIVDAMDFVCADGEREAPRIALIEALATLKAMQPVQPCGHVSKYYINTIDWRPGFSFENRSWLLYTPTKD